MCATLETIYAITWSFSTTDLVWHVGGGISQVPEGSGAEAQVLGWWDISIQRNNVALVLVDSDDSLQVPAVHMCVSHDFKQDATGVRNSMTGVLCMKCVFKQGQHIP